ncbi:MAG: ABC transporter permease [Candidatus Heimdallarchaeota archaeon]|nr:ABC transporter permease [Candidatus Heimdallarchaeota archaeon]
MIKISLRSYALRRLLYIFPTLLGISIISFALIAASPGDPIQIRLGLWIGEQPEYEEVYNQVGFDIGVLDENGEPVSMFVRYFRWLGLVKDQYGVRSGILQGNLGNSWFYTMSGNIGKPISDIIVGRLWYTLFLTTPAFVISTILATIIGVIQATRQYSLWDKGVTLASLIGFSMPVFWLAKLVMLTAFYLFNFTGATTGDAFTEPFLINPRFYLFLILPTVTLVLTGLVFLSRLTRSQLLDILRQDYITTARAKGLTERRVIYKHAFRNAMLPIITVVGLALPGLLGGSVMVEGVFGWPGLGSVFLTSALQRDQPMMMATNFVFGGMFLGFRLLVDLSYAIVDPRIRY